MKKSETKFGDGLKEFDFYKDLPRDLAEPTFLGATMSVAVIALMGTLLFYQFIEFMSF